MKLSKNLICLIGDLHFGEKGNSSKFNQQLLGLLDFAVSESKKRECKVCFQLGDWHHDRHKLVVETINFSLQGAEKLAAGFDEVYTIVSNHDTYFRDRLDVNSMKFLEPYMTVIDEPTIIMDGKVIAVPWIVSGEMWDDVIKLSKSSGIDYMFAHLELNGFKVNDAYEMEHGYSHKELRHLKHVYTGHYHSPQTKDNVTFCGTPIPITMNEANEAHGIYFLDLDTGNIEFVEYHGVSVISLKYTELESILDKLDPENTYIRVEFPDDLEDETIITDVQNLLTELNLSEFKIQYTPSVVKTILDGAETNVENVENIDAVVLQFLNESRKIAGVDNRLLAEIYNEAILRETE